MTDPAKLYAEAAYAAAPCDPVVPCEPGGEPCHTHERLRGCIEGTHDLCDTECPWKMMDGAELMAEAMEKSDSEALRMAASIIHDLLRLLGRPKEKSSD